MNKARQFLEQEIKAGRLLHTKGCTSGINDNSCEKLESVYFNARELLKKANEPKDKPMSYAIARALLEGYLKPNYEVGERSKK
ncbi:MAG: hypothetical protein BVN35_07345 [Proteobacteria bacterium ST_bin11]|jgi:hypothetical protein|nr:MAG: hypothetical protein BVN35_07345 [Proteobacteria bacterium ST_bin11]